MDLMKDNIDIDSEKVIIGSLLNSNGYDIWAEISDILTPNTFISDINKIVYKCVNHIFKTHADIKKIDYPLLLNTSKILNFGEFLAQKDEKKYLKEAVQTSLDRANARILAAKLRKLEVTRVIREELKLADQKYQTITGEEKLSDIINIVEKPILDFSRFLHGMETKATESLFEGIEEWVEDKINNPQQFVGISTGWPAFDNAIGGGLRLGTVGAIASRFGVGKTSVGENIGYYVASNNYPVLILDSEMSKEERKPRDLAMISGVTISEIEFGTFRTNKDKTNKVRLAAKNLREIHEKGLYEYRNISGMEFDEIVSIMKNWVLTKVGLDNNGQAKPCLIVFDYLKIQSSEGITKNIAEYIYLGLMITAFVNFCQKYKVAGLTFAQVNREGLKSEESSIIASSDRIGWMVAHLSFFKFQDEEEIAHQREIGIQDNYTHKLIILKSRHGPGLDRNNFINLKFNRYCCKITCGPTQFDLEQQAANILPNNPVVNTVEF